LAVDDGRIATNPASRLRLARVVRASKRYLTATQVRALAAAVGSRSGGARLGYDTLVLVLAYTGLRWAEAAGLRVADVDLVRGRLKVRQTVTVVEGRLTIEPPKTYEEREVPIGAMLRERLEDLIDGRPADAPVFPASRTGSWLRNHSFRGGWFDDAAAAVGLAGLTPHELRHTAASLAVSAGATVKGVQRMLGHASAKMTLDTYTDLFENDLDDLGDRLDALATSANVTQLPTRGSPDARATSSA
jgi:integrase